MESKRSAEEGHERDASWDLAEWYGADYFESYAGEPYNRQNQMWVSFFGSVADFIVDEFAPRTVLDAGCAIGFLVEALRDRGVDASGFDVSEYAISQVTDALKPYCVIGSVTDEIEGSFDLITCIEVLEHLPPVVADQAIANFARHTDRLLFSSTADDEEEPTHVNVRQPDEWVHVFAAHGFFPTTSRAALVIAPQAVVFERGEPVLVDALAAYERGRYEVVRHLRGSMTAAKAQASDLRAANGRAAAAEKASVDLRAALAELRGTTWWRAGRPVRGAVTFIRNYGMGSGGRRSARPDQKGSQWAPKRALMGAARRLPLSVRLRVRSRFPVVTERLTQVARPAPSAMSVEEIVADRFPLLRPLAVFPVPQDGKRHLTVVTDSLSAGSLFGGVGTSMIFAAMLARRLDASLRVVTRRARPEPSNFRTVLQAHGIDWERNVDFAYSRLESGGSLPCRAREVFLTTSWWSTWAALRSVDPERIVYLLQEDERLFYPSGDEQIACSEVMSDSRIRFAVNTAMLRDYLVAEGFENIGENGIAFEPAFPKSIYFRQTREAGDRRAFFFYARPHNVRNLFLRGLEAVKEALVQGILDPDEWELHFVGTGIPPITLPQGAVPIVSENLPWPEYAALVRRVDVGLSLMSTPHPSYPPLDLAACGGVAVTNRFGPKQSLDTYSENILCTDMSRDALVDGLSAAVALAADEPRRALNYRNQQLSRSWMSSLEPVVEQLARSL